MLGHRTVNECGPLAGTKRRRMGKHDRECDTLQDEDVLSMLQVARGDQDAFCKLYAKYVPVISLYVRSLDANGSCREDLVQEVFARVWERRLKYAPQSQVKTYFFAIARNVLLEHARALQRRARWAERGNVPDLTESQQPHVLLCEKELAGVLEQAMSLLSAKQREAIELVVCEGLSASDAARKAGCSVVALRNRLHQARRHMLLVLADL
jgi:RNA polymerase sigma-70 factor (ECF subfamily)